MGCIDSTLDGGGSGGGEGGGGSWRIGGRGHGRRGGVEREGVRSQHWADVWGMWFSGTRRISTCLQFEQRRCLKSERYLSPSDKCLPHAWPMPCRSVAARPTPSSGTASHQLHPPRRAAFPITFHLVSLTHALLYANIHGSGSHPYKGPATLLRASRPPFSHHHKTVSSLLHSFPFFSPLHLRFASFLVVLVQLPHGKIEHDVLAAAWNPRPRNVSTNLLNQLTCVSNQRTAPIKRTDILKTHPDRTGCTHYHRTEAALSGRTHSTPSPPWPCIGP